MTGREILIFAVFLAVLSSVGYLYYLESDSTPGWAAAPERISVDAGGIGIFLWRVEGGFWTAVAGRKAAFDVGPSTAVEIVSLNGQAVGKSSGVASTDGSGRIVVVVKSKAEGPTTLRGVDLSSGKSATAVRWSVAD